MNAASPGASAHGRRSAVSKACSAPFIVAILFYKVALSPLMSGHCRFLPTCSEYALATYRAVNPLRATFLTLRRVLRCHPLGGSGWDPPPERRPSADISDASRRSSSAFD